MGPIRFPPFSGTEDDCQRIVLCTASCFGASKPVALPTGLPYIWFNGRPRFTDPLRVKIFQFSDFMPRLQGVKQDRMRVCAFCLMANLITFFLELYRGHLPELPVLRLASGSGLKLLKRLESQVRIELIQMK
jgi:hypothetical protein